MTELKLLYDHIKDPVSRKENDQRIKNIVRFLAREYLGLTLSTICDYEEKHFGKRTHHATIINSCSTTQNRIREYMYAATIRELQEKIIKSFSGHGRSTPSLRSGEVRNSDEAVGSDDYSDVSRSAHGEQPTVSTPPAEKLVV